MENRSKIAKAACSLIALQSAVALARPPIETDRPDFVESSSTIAPLHMQIETSSEWLSIANGSATPSLLRIGVADNLELRAESDGYVSEDGERGLADLSVGLKLHVGGEDDAVSKAWLLHVDLPSGDAALRQPGLRPSLRYIAELELPSEFSLGLMPGFAWDDDDTGRRRPGGIFGIVLGHPIDAWSRAFMECAFERIAVTRDDHTIGSFNTGIALRLGPDAQLDGSLRFGLTPDTPDVAAAIGLSARW